MNRLSYWGVRLAAAFLIMIGFATLGRLLIEALKDRDDGQDGENQENRENGENNQFEGTNGHRAAS